MKQTHNISFKRALSGHRQVSGLIKGGALLWLQGGRAP
jgi:hypothetical protein